MAGDIGELLAEAGLGRDAGALLLQPVAEGLDQRGAARLALGEPPLGRAATDLGLDGVEFGDPAQALGRDLRAAAVVDFAEPEPTMCPAVCLPQRRAAIASRPTPDPRLGRLFQCREAARGAGRANSGRGISKRPACGYDG